jgi:hypothetical protein
MRVILLSIILFVSCNSSITEIKDEQLSSKPDSKPDSKVIKSDFREFWNNLGQALRVNDTIALDKYLDSTVFLYGREDQDPRFELNSRDRIIKVREIYLNSGTYDYQNDINISYMYFFLDSNALNREFVEGQDNQDIEDFVFKRDKWDEWKLIGVYSDTKSQKRKELKKEVTK